MGSGHTGGGRLMLRRGFVGLLFGGGFVYFFLNLYATPESEYVESLSKGEATNNLHIRFVSSQDKRAEIRHIRTVANETVYATTAVDARLPRMSVEYPSDAEFRLELISRKREVLESHDLEDIQE